MTKPGPNLQKHEKVTYVYCSDVILERGHLWSITKTIKWHYCTKLLLRLLQLRRRAQFTAMSLFNRNPTMVLDRFMTFQGTWRIANARKTLITFQGGVLNSGWYKYLTDERELQRLTRDELGSIRLGILSPNATLSPSLFSTKAENKRMKKKVERRNSPSPSPG